MNQCRAPEPHSLFYQRNQTISERTVCTDMVFHHQLQAELVSISALDRVKTSKSTSKTKNLPVLSIVNCTPKSLQASLVDLQKTYTTQMVMRVTIAKVFPCSAQRDNCVPLMLKIASLAPDSVAKWWKPRTSRHSAPKVNFLLAVVIILVTVVTKGEYQSSRRLSPERVS